MLSAEQSVFDPKWNRPSLFGGLSIYSPTRRRKKKATMIMSTAARRLRGARGSNATAAAASMISTGSANIGFGAGSRAPGIVVSSQNEGLRHETELGVDNLSTNLLLVPVDPSSNPSGKAQKGLLFDRLGFGSQVGVTTDLCGKCCPICPCSGSGRFVHFRSGNRLPRRVEITFESISVLGWAGVQDLFWGNGNC
eukprot:scaffold3149_cov26-Attheya_sp.AAC.1